MLVKKARDLGKAFLNIAAAVFLGLMLLEAILRTNPKLLLRGIHGPAPETPALVSRKYEVYYSDADLINWRPDLINAIAPAQDKLEAIVEFETDEFGFRNSAPLPAQVNVVVLGRSYSLGAQIEHNWSMQLADQTNLSVLNLSRPGGDIHSRIEDLKRFGLQREPQWVILEIMPRIDIVDATPQNPFLITKLPVPILQDFFKSFVLNLNSEPASPRFPIPIGIGPSDYDLTCCIHYVDTWSVDEHELEASLSWETYQEALLELISLARSHEFELLLLFAPGKADVYFPLADDPDTLTAILEGWMPLSIDERGELSPSANEVYTPQDAITNLNAPANLLQNFALEETIVFINPTAAMQQSALIGQHPFLAYDSHLNESGHSIIADQILAFLIP